jgi:predicted metal-dependent hydrolase
LLLVGYSIQRIVVLMTPDVTYTIRESARAKRIRIAVYRSGEVVLVKPKGTSNRLAMAFFESKKDWVHAKLQEMPLEKNLDLHSDSGYHYLLHKPSARTCAEEKVRQWNLFYNFSFTRIEIKQMTSRWGSCSSSKTLCFNYKILFLPEELQDYLVVHELCHLAEMNHSSKFWDQVGRSLPEYKALRRALRTLS